MFWICSWWVFAAQTMLLPQGPTHFSIHTFLIKACTCSIIILNLYGPYCWFLQQTGFAFPVFTENLYPRIVNIAPSLQKLSQYFSTIAINCSFISGITLLLHFICFCSYLLCSSSLNVIKFVRLTSSHVCLGMYTAIP